MEESSVSKVQVSVICPLYNGEQYIENLHNSILKQKDIESLEILYVLTESKDKSEEILNKIGADYEKIKKEEFSHSKTRETMAYKAQGEVIVFITQDVIIKDEYWLTNLITPILKGECEASFSRQICDNNTIEKYIREKNYPTVSRVVSKKDISQYGLMTFFYSDASSAIKASIFRKLKGYDGKNLIINEDMYIAHKLIMKGYRIKYCSDSQVIHSHIFTLKQLFTRYFDTGVFFKGNNYFLSYKTNESGMKLLKYTLINSVKDKNIKVLFNVIPNFAARFIGSYLGKRYDTMSLDKRIKYSLNKKYWTEKSLEGEK